MEYIKIFFKILLYVNFILHTVYFVKFIYSKEDKGVLLKYSNNIRHFLIMVVLIFILYILDNVRW